MDFFSFTGAASGAVMKDGSRGRILNKEFAEAVDPDRAEDVLLADGTKTAGSHM